MILRHRMNMATTFIRDHCIHPSNCMLHLGPLKNTYGNLSRHVTQRTVVYGMSRTRPRQQQKPQTKANQPTKDHELL
jgi:hypothetical protein